MPNPVETDAWISVARGCGFAGLATVCGMIGVSFDPALSLKFGGYCALLTCAILLLKAWRANNVRYSRTDIWMLLEKDERPPKSMAQMVITEARRRMLYRFASLTAWISLIMFAGAVLLQAAPG